jgi:flagellar hook-basal body complex protein FliE
MDIAPTLAAQAYARAQTETAPLAADAAANGFARVMGSLAASLDRAETVAREAMLGQADPHALVGALAASQTAIETAVTLRDRVVEAYQELLRMPV